MFLQLPTAGHPSLEFGITIRAWSLIFAADAFTSTRTALEGMDLIALRCRQGTLRVSPTRPRIHAGPHHHSAHSTKTLDPSKVGIAAIPLELLLAFRDTVIDSALWDAEQRNMKCAEAAHEEYNSHEPGPHGHLPFTQCLYHASVGELQMLCDACAKYSGPHIDYKAIKGLLVKYSLSLVSSTSTPLLTSPPYSPIEPHPWVVALATHHAQPMSRSRSFLPAHMPSRHLSHTPTTEISFFAPSFMRITSSDIMRFRNLVRTWRLAVVELPGPVAMRGSESASRSRSTSHPEEVPGAMLDIEAMELVQSFPTMGHCEPKWMLLNPNRHTG